MISISDELTPDEQIDSEFDNMTGIVSGIATFGIIANATQSKLNQLPDDTPIDPLNPPKPRVLVFVTKNDSKVCRICERYEGVEYEENDPFIVRPIEDTHLRCRCRLIIKGMDEELIAG